jgi:hypothetical protein
MFENNENTVSDGRMDKRKIGILNIDFIMSNIFFRVNLCAIVLVTTRSKLVYILKSVEK